MGILEEIAKDHDKWERHCDIVNGLTRLGNNLEMAAALQACISFGYARGFEHGVTVHDFCEPQAGDQTYFPLDLRYWKGYRAESESNNPS